MFGVKRVQMGLLYQNHIRICDDPREMGIFEDVDVKFQAHLSLKFDVDVFKHMMPFLADRHIYADLVLLNTSIFLFGYTRSDRICRFRR